MTLENWSYEKMDLTIKASKVPVVVEFWMPGCKPCVAVSAMLGKLADEFEGEVVFGKVKADEYRGDRQLSAVPVTILNVNGAIYGMYNGIISEGAFREDLERAIEEMEND